MIGLVMFGNAVACQTQHQTDFPVTAVCLIPGQSVMLAGSDRGLQLYDDATLSATRKLDSKLEKIYSIKLSTDGRRVAVAGGTPGEEGAVEVYSVPEFQRVQVFGGFDDVALDLVWLANDRLIAADATGDCRRFQLGNQESSLFSVHADGILAIDTLNSGQILSAGQDHIIRVWRPDKPLIARDLNNHSGAVNDIKIRPSTDATKTRLPMVASASDDRTVRFWQPTIGRMVRFAKLSSIPTSIVWMHDGSQVIVGCRDGSIHVVDPTNANQGKLSVQARSWINDLQLSNDDRTLYVADQQGVRRVPMKRSTDQFDR